MEMWFRESFEFLELREKKIKYLCIKNKLFV